MNNNNDNTKTDSSRQGQANVQPIRDEPSKQGAAQASAPSKTQGEANTAKRDASGKDGTAGSTSGSAK